MYFFFFLFSIYKRIPKIHTKITSHWLSWITASGLIKTLNSFNIFKNSNCCIVVNKYMFINKLRELLNKKVMWHRILVRYISLPINLMHYVHCYWNLHYDLYTWIEMRSYAFYDMYQIYVLSFSVITTESIFFFLPWFLRLIIIIVLD